MEGSLATLKTSLCNPVPLPLTLIPCSRLLPSSPSCTRVHLIATPTETRIDTTHCSGNSPDFPARFRISTGHLKDHPRHLARIGPPTDWWLGREFLARRESLLAGISREFSQYSHSILGRGNYKFEYHGWRDDEAKNFNPLGYLDTIGGGKQRSERMVEGIFFDNGGPYQRRTHGCWSLRFLKNCTGRLLGLIMRANPPFASLCASITDPLYVGNRSDASFFLLTVS